MMKLKGTIIRETDKAIRFHVTEDLLIHLQDGKYWFPKSKIRLPKHKEGEITIYVQNWLYDATVTKPAYYGVGKLT
ncbi:unnamed protein product [marine sediment metagenome]|uniref:Uncharacterized protein n=1 Tax=marine sediment metagenome TaxID=412755 RepID=X0VT37_9ZZZZ